MSFAYRLPLVAVLFSLVGAVQSIAQTSRQSYADVMLVINDRSWASANVGQYFALRRGIPDRHICRINVDTSETIDSVRFLQLRWQIKEWMRSRNLVDSINYIVTTKGCPLRVRTTQWDVINAGRIVAIGGQASFEDCLALMNDVDSSVALGVKATFDPVINPYYGQTARFRRGPAFPMYLVTRLDAYTVEQVRSMIRRAEEPAFLGDGLWVLDVDPGKDASEGYKVGNDWLRRADSILGPRGMNVMINRDTQYVHGQSNVIGYASWGSNDSHSGGRSGAIPGNTWLNGSIAETFVSTGGRTFNDGTTGGQSLIADWIAEGANGVKGYTDEPYLSAIANPDILFDRYTNGYNLAESFWSASVFRAWRQVVIGDPKMMLRSMLAASDSVVDFASHPRYSVTRDTIRLINNSSAPVHLTALSTSGPNAADFSFQLVNGLFPETIAPGGEIMVQVLFRPVGYGARRATLVAEYKRDLSTPPWTFTLTAMGETMQPELSIVAGASTDAFDFGAVAIGDSATAQVVVRNHTPSDTVTLTRYDKTAGATGRFTVVPSSPFPAKLFGDDDFALDVTYRPSTAVRDSMVLSVYHQISGRGPLRLKMYGTGAVSGVEEATEATLTSLTATPNPFKIQSDLTLKLAHGAHVRVELYDIAGKSVLTVADRNYTAGEHHLMIDGRGIPAGAYLLHLTTTDHEGHPVARVASLVKQ